LAPLIDLLNDVEHSPWFDRIAKVNPVYGEAWATAGHFFIINRRYDEGIAAYRKPSPSIRIYGTPVPNSE